MTPGLSRSRLLVVSVAGLFILALGYTISLAQSIVNPILFAVLLNYLLSPAVRYLRRLRIPEAVSATVLLLLVAGGMGAAVMGLAAPAATWVKRVPEAVVKLERIGRSVQKQVKPIADAANNIQDAAKLNQGSKTPMVQVSGPSLMDRMFGQTTGLLGGALMSFFLAWLLLAPGDLFQQKLMALIRSRRSKNQVEEISVEVENQISRYLLTVIAVNIAVGVATGFAMWALGLPNPALWGWIAGILNFIPYVGMVLTAVVIGLAAVIEFNSVAQMVWPPIVFLIINTFESNLLTPKVLERWLAINAVASFLAVIIFWMLLGIMGALLAVPILVVIKIMCDRVESFKSFGTFLEV